MKWQRTDLLSNIIAMDFPFPHIQYLFNTDLFFFFINLIQYMEKALMGSVILIKKVSTGIEQSDASLIKHPIRMWGNGQSIKQELKLVSTKAQPIWSFFLTFIHVYILHLKNINIINYSESKYSVELLSCKYLVNRWSDQHGDFSVEFRIEKLTTFSTALHIWHINWVCKVLYAYEKQLQRYLHESNSTEYLDSLYSIMACVILGIFNCTIVL